MEHVTLAELRATSDAGKVLGVTLKAEGGSFEMQIKTGTGMVTLVKTRSKTAPRRFPDPRKALLLLHEIGIHQTRVDSQNWRPDEPDSERQPRPDRAQAMKAAHEALSRTDWLQQKLARSIADSEERISHDDVMKNAQALIDKKHRNQA